MSRPDFVEIDAKRTRNLCRVVDERLWAFGMGQRVEFFAAMGRVYCVRCGRPQPDRGPCQCGPNSRGRG